MAINWTNVFHDCIKMLPVMLSFVASFMLVKSRLKFSAENTIVLWTFGAGKVMRQNITSEHANAIVGFGFLLVSIILQIFNLSFPVRIRDLRGIEKTSIPILIAILFGLLFIGILISKKLKNRFLRLIEEREKWWGKEKKNV